MEYSALKKIRPYELLAWNKKENIKNAPNVAAAVDWFNRYFVGSYFLKLFFFSVSMWVCTEILRRESVEERSVTIVNFINIGSRLKENHNFNSLMEIISGLHSGQNKEILRLKYCSFNFTIEKLLEAYSFHSHG